jgi:conjugative relaxase-like TrwC/TraI family protein
MSLHKLTAGSGYDYLTRQVAALDATDKGHTGLAAYYTERGESPGVWVGCGLDGIDGLGAGDPVTAEQMRALFGFGMHPLAEARLQQLDGPDVTLRDLENVMRLGTPFKDFDQATPFQVAVAERIADLNATNGGPADAKVATSDRARVRTEVAREFFRAEHGRDPVDARELAGQIAKDSRPRASTVAGYDLTFSPVKSVSALWAVADPTVAAVIERAHQAAVGDALRFIEEYALFTRTGAQGIRQVNVRGLVAVAFTHRDSRAGDPDLHTHVAVANKVQTLDGRWLSIDGRVLFKVKVTASETYNTALERHLRDALGVRFAERPGTDPGKRPIREIVGVDPGLNQLWSTRRACIDARRGELAVQFHADHGRPPTPVEALHLAQRATLETRDAKHEPRSEAEQRRVWMAEAAEVLGGRRAVEAMVAATLAATVAPVQRADASWVDAPSRSRRGGAGADQTPSARGRRRGVRRPRIRRRDRHPDRRACGGDRPDALPGMGQQAGTAARVHGASTGRDTWTATGRPAPRHCRRPDAATERPSYLDHRPGRPAPPDRRAGGPRLAALPRLRRVTYGRLITRLPLEALRPGLTHESAADTAWALASPECWDLLIGRLLRRGLPGVGRRHARGHPAAPVAAQRLTTSPLI